MPAMPMADSSAPIVVGMSADQERDQIGDVDSGLQVDRNGRHGGYHDDEDQRQYGKQDGQSHLVRSFLPLRAFHEMDHAVEEALTRIGGGADEQ